MPSGIDYVREFLSFKKEKLKHIADIEAKRLEDLKDARATIFKFALPSSIINGAAGALATLLTGNILILIPVALFMILIYFLADDLDRKKHTERMDIMEKTETSQHEIREQEVELLGSVLIVQDK